MYFSTPDDEKQQLNGVNAVELLIKPPSESNIPSGLMKYADGLHWVAWGYETDVNGFSVPKQRCQPAKLAGVYEMCHELQAGLGFMVTDNNSISVIHLPNYFAADGCTVDENRTPIVNSLRSYKQRDHTGYGLHIMLHAFLKMNTQGDGIQVWNHDYMLPITGDKFGDEAEIGWLDDQLKSVVANFCHPTWLQKVDQLRGTGSEEEILTTVLDECLETIASFEDPGDRTQLYPFLAKCWEYMKLRVMVRSRAPKPPLYVNRDALKEIVDVIESYMPKKEKVPKAEKVGDPVPGELGGMLQYDAKGNKVLETFYNMAMILEHHKEWVGRIRFDEFRNRAMLDDKPVSDETEFRVSEWLGREYAFGGNRRKILSEAILSVATKDKYDALTEWMGDLPDWDGTRRLDTWMVDMCGAEDCDYSKWVSKVTILQMVNRALNPGCIARLVPIWNGKENQGKSTAIALLGGDWATTLKISLENKEAHMAIHGYWVAELEELDTLYKTSEARLKAFLTNTSDHYVPKYANHSVDYPRRTVFIGTTNDIDYLRGLTGNTRFLPINTGGFDLDAIRDQRMQLFSEAKQWLAEHPSAHWWEEPEDIRPIIQEQRDSRRVINVYEEDLQGFLNGNDPRSPGYRYKTTWNELCELYFEFKGRDQWKDKSLQNQVTDALKAIGWFRTRTNGKSTWNRPDAQGDDNVPF